MLQRAREAKGRPLTLEERARYVEMADEIEKAQAELAEAQARAQESHAEKLASHQLMGKKRRKELRLETREDLEEELASVRSEMSSVKFQMLKLSNPETSLTPELVDRIEKLAGNEIYVGIAQNRVDTGINTSLSYGFIDVIHEIVSEDTPDITKREVAEVISGYCYGDGPKWYERLFWSCKYWLWSRHLNRFARWRHGLD